MIRRCDSWLHSLLLAGMQPFSRPISQSRHGALHWNNAMASWAFCVPDTLESLIVRNLLRHRRRRSARVRLQAVRLAEKQDSVGARPAKRFIIVEASAISVGYAPGSRTNDRSSNNQSLAHQVPVKEQNRRHRYRRPLHAS